MDVFFGRNNFKVLFYKYFLLVIITSFYFNLAQGQVSKNDILPYINDLIGSPKNSYTESKINNFEKKLKQIHNAGDDFPVSITYEYDSYLGIDFLKKIRILVPYEKGSYYYPLQISLGEFSLKSPSYKTYNPTFLKTELTETTKVSYSDHVNATLYLYPDEDLINYERIEHSLRYKSPLRALIIEPLQAIYKGKTKKSPYGYTPEKDHLVFCGFDFIIDKEYTAAKGHYTKYFTQKANKKNNLSVKETDIYFNLLYDNIEYLYKKRYQLDEDEIDNFIIPKLKKRAEIENYINKINNNLLGDSPFMNAKYAIFKLNENEYKCSGGNCFYRKQSIKYKYGTFTGYFLNNKATHGSFILPNSNSTINLFSSNKNGFMDSIEFTNILYNYVAVFDYEKKKWEINIKFPNGLAYSGEMTFMCGTTTGSENDDYIYYQTFVYNLNSGLKYAKLNSYNGYAFVTLDTKSTEFRYSFLWNAIKAKIQNNKLTFYSISKTPSIFMTYFGNDALGLSFREKDSVSFDIVPEFKEQMEILISKLDEAQSNEINKPLMDYYSFSYLTKKLGDAMAKIQEVQFAFTRSAYNAFDKYKRFDGLDGAKKYSERMVLTLESLFAANAYLQQGTKYNNTKEMSLKIKEWKDYEISVRDDYNRLKEAVETDYYKLPKSQIKAYIKKLTAEFR